MNKQDIFLSRVQTELPHCSPWVTGNLDLFFPSDVSSELQTPQRRISSEGIQQLLSAARERYVGRYVKVPSRRIKSKHLRGYHEIPGWRGRIIDVRWKNNDLIIDTRDTQSRYRPAKEWQILRKGEKSIRKELGL